MQIRFYEIALPLFCSLIGFYGGNILPTTFQGFFSWSHYIAFFLLFFNELYGFTFFRILSKKYSDIAYEQFYRKNSISEYVKIFTQKTESKNKVSNSIPPGVSEPHIRSESPFREITVPFLFYFFSRSTKNKKFSFFFIRCFQFGILFGLFVDAFKVGS
uniref:Uncharacterized protein n=1 Tax=Microrhizoidea pickettheapsiorum TaxID=2604950 RepID=A0A5B9RFS5_9CHLO|nr:hypothetical protein [Microrhizoidea pickettheapsiorum]QEG77701.1 hypothetical protein [Microrhizoidea pickettheapsiorum]